MTGARPRHQRTATGVTKAHARQLSQEFPSPLRQVWEKNKPESFSTKDGFQKEFVKAIEHNLARSMYNADDLAAYQATSLAMRDKLISAWNDTQNLYTEKDPKRIYYFSFEFLQGRALDNAMLNLGVKQVIKDGSLELGFRLEDLIEEEQDHALGNGGLGRLASCFLDSCASTHIPAGGYGMNYRYGLFKQTIVNGQQVERPDSWLENNHWELPRHDIQVPIRFGGNVHQETDKDGKQKSVWDGGMLVVAEAYDVPIPSYKSRITNNLRLWSSKPAHGDFDFAAFNSGDYENAVRDTQKAEEISQVLYPNENHTQGKELRLKQQYFWCAASLSDIVRRFKKSERPFSEFADQVAIQLNDTHPVIAIPELLRILIDLEGLTFDDALSIVQKTFGYTNHTVMPEALEKWPCDMIGKILPRHLEIIFDINLSFLQQVEKKFPGDRDLLARVSIIEEGDVKQVRMAYLGIVGSHKTNGVSELHSDLIQTTIFKDFAKIFGKDRFGNVTNGITPRRWLLQANPLLSDLIASKLGGQDFIKELTLLKHLESFADDKDFVQRWIAVKTQNKERLARYIQEHNGVTVDPTALFDIQIKRIHEYKRQHMHLFSCIHRYLELKEMSPEERKKQQKRVSIFAGKAAPGYYTAKEIIHLIHAVAEVVNNDAEIGDLLKVIFIADYNVSKAEVIIPAADISEHISTAGTEASGTSNMKFCLNASLIIGTYDGANIEICREVGEENVYIFGYLAHDIEDLRHQHRYGNYKPDPRFERVLDVVRSGKFGDANQFRGVLDSLQPRNDHYLLADDFASYLDSKKLIDTDFADQLAWHRKTINTVARMGFFSSDRAVQQYAEEIWNVEAIKF
ncbi:glycosyl transferase [Protomyces lactucae-debilis]|uniref:Alpha-1,4 glucan phosphorylase n=1 Tax=Protomyces lactucae-debilis TaxID=2754530 RepID=A0A1Y2FS75_PROLT|nr:glycosyl transferase [Protomyces lactucae-debilis]ORY86838.1 glycosyl transferase [Protomyces lactucae-debilis]